MLIREAKPIKKLTQGKGRVRAKVQDSAFFKFEISDTSDLENHLLLLNVSRKNNLRVFIHKKSYPSQLFNEHEYALGDLPADIL